MLHPTCSALAPFLFIASLAAAQTPVIHILPGLPGGGSPMQPWGVSADGSTVVGTSHLGSQRAVYWTAAGGIADLSPAHNAFAASQDGAVIVGQNGPRAARWTQATGWQDITTVNATAFSVSFDGTVAVGVTNSNPTRAFRWVQGEGVTILPVPEFAEHGEGHVISGDGNVMWGSYLLGGSWYGFRWTPSSGLQAYTGMSPMRGTNTAGTFAVGGRTNAASIGSFWSPGGIGSIPAFPPLTSGSAVGFSADGRLIYGSGNTPYIWDAENGPRPLQAYLASTYGLDFTGITLATLRAVSASGSHFIGQAFTQQGERGYLITVPPPPSPPPAAAQWTSLGGVPGVNGHIYAMRVWDPDGAGPGQPELIVGGSFTIAGDAKALNIAAMDLSTGEWSALGWGIGGAVFALEALHTGELVAGGQFTSADGLPAYGVASWNGSSWTAMGTTYGERLNDIDCLAVMPDGTLIAGGSFDTNTGAPSSRVARWNGSGWGPLPGGGLDNSPHAFALTPQGHLIAAGLFLHAGGVPANRIARWDGAGWHALGDGLSGRARSVLVQPNGNIVVGGEFWQAAGTVVNQLARWDGSSWTSIGGGTAGSGSGGSDVFALHALPGGDLAIGGAFTTVGPNTLTANGIARWDGEQWSAFGTGVGGTAAAVRSILTLPGGDLLACGSFSSAGGLGAMSIARWDGQRWRPVTNGLNAPVHALAAAPEGDMLVGGAFTAAGGLAVGKVARSDGVAWSALGSGVAGSGSRVESVLGVAPNHVFIGGKFDTVGGIPAQNVAHWDGQEWHELGPGLNGFVFALSHYQGSVLAGGTFTASGPTQVRSMAIWNGAVWVPLGGGGSGGVEAFLQGPGSQVVAAGGLTELFGPGLPVPPNGVAEWDGTLWTPFGGGVPTPYIRALARLHTGDIVAAGRSLPSGSLVGIARWDGNTWTPLTSSIGSLNGDSEIRALAVMQNGDLVAGGWFDTIDGRPASSIARWDGTSWAAMAGGVGGTGPQHSWVDALAVDAAGDLWIGGNFITVGDRISPYLAKWSKARCYANCDGSTAAPILNVADFTCFLQRFAAADPWSNCDQSTTPPVLNVADFTCFLQSFAAGCP